MLVQARYIFWRTVATIAYPMIVLVHWIGTQEAKAYDKWYQQNHPTPRHQGLGDP